MTIANLVGYLAALALAAAAVLAVGRPAAPAAATAETAPAVPAPRWQRIVSLDLVADELLAHLVAPGRIAAVSTWAQGPEAWRHEGLPRLPGLTDLEAILRLGPDLVLVSTFGGESDRLTRLREAGIEVLDLGPAGGLRELTANLRRVGAAVGAADRGELLAQRLERRMAAVAARLSPGTPRPRALVLTPAVEQVYGGTVGSSYHDIVIAAGLSDAAAGRFAEAWPRITAETALTIDPDCIVTRAGAGAELARLPGFARLRAVRAGAVHELPVDLFDSPGLAMLDAAEYLHQLAWP